MTIQNSKFISFKLILFCAIFISGFLLCQKTLAADYYVRADATGSNNGSDWTNAYTALPATLDRGTNGSTYYIADGNYEGYLFDSTTAAVDGTKIITIKKATASVHGSEIGWQSSYGDGQAVFQWADPGAELRGYKLNTFRILVSYITIDGAVGGGSDADDYGFKLVMAPNFGGSAEGYTDYDWWTAVSIGAVGESDLALTNITLQHIAAIGPAITKDYSCFHDGSCSNEGVSAYLLETGSLTNMTLESSLLTHWNNNISIRLTTNLNISNNYVSDNWSSSTGDHGQNINIDGITNGVIKDNKIIRSKEFAIAIHRNADPDYTGTSGLKIYNNLFYGANPSMSGFISTMGNQSDGITEGLQVHHNTLVDQNCGGKGFVGVTTITDPTVISYVYNNLFYNTENCRLDNSGYTQNMITHDYNAYLSSTNYTSEAHSQVDVSADDPFTNSASGDYTINSIVDAANDAHLINTGKTDLGATYAYDFAGTERGASPDIGAYEYVGAADTTAPASPTGLAVQ